MYIYVCIWHPKTKAVNFTVDDEKMRTTLPPGESKDDLFKKISNANTGLKIGSNLRSRSSKDTLQNFYIRMYGCVCKPHLAVNTKTTAKHHSVTCIITTICGAITFLTGTYFDMNSSLPSPVHSKY
uniref:Uncharacterized protein n=1 Tax=Glossina brevipalpis TaxID=37001 RepID=A0A1A9W4M5_9MUSC